MFFKNIEFQFSNWTRCLSDKTGNIYNWKTGSHNFDLIFLRIAMSFDEKIFDLRADDHK